MAKRNKRPYSAWWLSWTLSNSPRPIMVITMLPMAKKKRCFIQSDTKAMNMDQTKAQAHGGTEISCVWMAL